MCLDNTSHLLPPSRGSRSLPAYRIDTIGLYLESASSFFRTFELTTIRKSILHVRSPPFLVLRIGCRLRPRWPHFRVSLPICPSFFPRPEGFFETFPMQLYATDPDHLL